MLKKIYKFLKEDYEPETVFKELNIELDEKKKNFYYACKTAYDGKFSDDFFIAEKVVLSICCKEVDFSTVQQPTIVDAAVGHYFIELINAIKNKPEVDIKELTNEDIKGIIEKENIMSEEIKRYIASILIINNFFVAPKEMSEIQPYLDEYVQANFPFLFVKIPKLKMSLNKEENVFAEETVEYEQFEKIKMLKYDTGEVIKEDAF